MTRRRSVLGWMTGAAVSAVAGSARAALPPPTDRVLLHVTGAVRERNHPEGAQFDLAMLQQLPVRHVRTRTPWYAQPRHFTGVTLRELFQALGADPQVVTAEALNDYRADIPHEDWHQHELMVAYHLDDRPMAVRDKGPLVLIYPFDDLPAVRTAVHYGRAVWQLKRLELR